MATRKRGAGDGRSHQFGGDWTTKKLDVLAAYLETYLKALKNQPFPKIYIDAFAGTGYRDRPVSGDGVSLPLEFPDLADSAPQDLLDGSARRALKIELAFDRYLFIEKSAKRCAALEQLKTEFPHRASCIEVRRGDANQEIQRLCKTEAWRSQRAVLFLDPYGMAVRWETIKAVAATRAIDLWLLVPLGMGLNRVLTQSGQMPPEWEKLLDEFLGTSEWRAKLYLPRQDGQQSLFDDEGERRVKAGMKMIGKYFNERLTTLFPGVVEEPGALRNSSNAPLYLLCFAAANDAGALIAKRIATSLLKDLR